MANTRKSPDLRVGRPAMRAGWWTGAFALTLLASVVQAQDVQQANWGRRNCPPPSCAPCTPLVADGTVPRTDQNLTQPPATNAFAQAGEGGTAPAASFQPGFFGDLIGYSATRVARDPFGNTPLVRVPLAARPGLKLTDNKSPRPP